MSEVPGVSPGLVGYVYEKFGRVRRFIDLTVGCGLNPRSWVKRMFWGKEVNWWILGQRGGGLARHEHATP
jgi:hypothetical protein